MKKLLTKQDIEYLNNSNVVKDFIPTKKLKRSILDSQTKLTNTYEVKLGFYKDELVKKVLEYLKYRHNLDLKKEYTTLTYKNNLDDCLKILEIINEDQSNILNLDNQLSNIFSMELNRYTEKYFTDEQLYITTHKGDFKTEMYKKVQKLYNAIIKKLNYDNVAVGITNKSDQIKIYKKDRGAGNRRYGRFVSKNNIIIDGSYKSDETKYIGYYIIRELCENNDKLSDINNGIFTSTEHSDKIYGLDKYKD